MYKTGMKLRCIKTSTTENGTTFNYGQFFAIGSVLKITETNVASLTVEVNKKFHMQVWYRDVPQLFEIVPENYDDKIETLTQEFIASKPKCECGAHKSGHNIHYTWCQLFERNIN